MPPVSILSSVPRIFGQDWIQLLKQYLEEANFTNTWEPLNSCIYFLKYRQSFSSLHQTTYNYINTIRIFLYKIISEKPNCTFPSLSFCSSQLSVHEIEWQPPPFAKEKYKCLNVKFIHQLLLYLLLFCIHCVHDLFSIYEKLTLDTNTYEYVREDNAPLLSDQGKIIGEAGTCVKPLERQTATKLVSYTSVKVGLNYILYTVQEYFGQTTCIQTTSIWLNVCSSGIT